MHFNKLIKINNSKCNHRIKENNNRKNKNEYKC